MLKFKLLADQKHFKLEEYSLNMEKTSLFSWFKKKSKDAEFNILVTRKIWDGMDHFISKEGVISIELWKEILNFSKKTGIEVDVEGIDRMMDGSLDKESYTQFVDSLFKGVLTDKGEPLYPRDYQLEGAFRALKYQFCCQELATSAGKTAIFYTFNSYLKHIGAINSQHKALMIVPNVSLVNQTVNAFEQYSNGLVKWKIHSVGGDNDFNLKEFLDCDMLITTYQSLINLVPECLDKKLETLIKKRVKKDEADDRDAKKAKLIEKINEIKKINLPSYFKVLNIDEAHKSRGGSISDIIAACKNWSYKLGLSGTMKLNEKYSDFFKMQQNVGPLVMTLDAKFLIDNDYSPNIKIKQIFLEYEESGEKISEYVKIQRDPDLKDRVKAQFKDPKNYGIHMLGIEKSIIFDSEERIKFISRFVKKLGKNTLILFSDIENGYGSRICDAIRFWNDHTYYIDGSIKNSDREIYKDTMESVDGSVIVASYGTFATGIDLKNVHHIIFAESTKAEITIRQAIGRGMRYLKGKEEVIIWDIIDDLSGYSVRHGSERMKIYKEQKFKILPETRINLSNIN